MKLSKTSWKVDILDYNQPDICFAVQVLSQFMQLSKKSHWDAALRVVRYVKKSSGLGVSLSRNAIIEMSVFCDLDRVSYLNTRRSVIGFAVQLGGSLISWKCKKQHTASKSSVEAEYMPMASTVSEVVRLLGLLKDLQVSVALPIKVSCDSKLSNYSNSCQSHIS
ncbi:secreted RxLR effector protein 161-like [Lycium barbarum]|uniref:secreted RxLR effector protein 161-like n=1 Tax=Lycium barbarum TaxID=112863 RepID=UPI00293E5990|nr:secreted RxLR effector protein 161-like [Lycium barbarum]